jgi:hypothetical protein
MRKMTDGSQTVNVLQWIQTKGNFWEYYVTENWNDDNCAFCLVDGDFQELGLVSWDEIEPYISAISTNLNNLQPARGWNWVD